MLLIHCGIVLVLVAAFVQSGTIDNSLGEDSYESNEFLDEDNSHSKNGSRVIFPGTKWCGPGNTAEHDNDLGHFEETDKCCRAHDHCDGIEAGGSKYGLVNNSPYTKLHCSCDKTFYKCLQNVDDEMYSSRMIGEMYFVANEKCYKKAHPILECEDYVHFLWMSRCTKYRVDVTKPKIYQYFDLPFYNTLDRSLNMARSACNSKSLIYKLARK